MTSFYETQRKALNDAASTWQSLLDGGPQVLATFCHPGGGMQGTAEWLRGAVLLAAEAARIAGDQAPRAWVATGGASQIRSLGEKGSSLCALQLDLADAFWTTLRTQTASSAEAALAWTSALASVRDSADLSMAHFEFGERLQAIAKSAMTQQALTLAGLQPALLEWLKPASSQTETASVKRK